jgi:hypothetical protein
LLRKIARRDDYASQQGSGPYRLDFPARQKRKTKTNIRREARQSRQASSAAAIFGDMPAADGNGRAIMATKQ